MVLTSPSAPEDAPEVGNGEGEEEGGEVFEFRLFGDQIGNSGEAQKIVLNDEHEESSGAGGFLRLRDPRVFFVERAVGDRKARFEAVAVSGEEVKQNSGKRAWGLEVPWRVRVLRVTEKGTIQPSTFDANEDEADGEDIKKRRPGKKRRVILRCRKKLRDEMAKKRQLDLESKQEAEKEKRTRKNREKKVKKRLKEKAKKSASGEAVVGTEASGIEVKVSDIDG